MSLIYQALKQTEQQAAPLQPSGRRRTGVATPAPVRRGWNPAPVLWGVGSVTVAVLTGWMVSLALAAQQGPSAAPAPAPAAPALPGAAPVALPVADLPEVDLPKADRPLPTASPQLVFSPSLSVPAPAATGPARAPAGSEQNVSNVPNAQDARQSAEPAAARKGDAESAPPPASVPVARPVPDELPALFDALNHALAGHDVDTARQQLLAIQAKLPESSVARLRAEAWFAHQTDDLDGAQRLYRRLLAKLSGDEHASLNLAAIEKKRLRLDQARDVLAKSLRQNPNSAVLRTAVDQLARSEAQP